MEPIFHRFFQFSTKIPPLRANKCSLLTRREAPFKIKIPPHAGFFGMPLMRRVTQNSKSVAKLALLFFLFLGFQRIENQINSFFDDFNSVGFFFLGTDF